jgi:anti-anti-sigma regulatory factor
MRTSFQFSCDPPLARLRITGELDLDASDRLLDVLGCLAFRGCTQVELDLDGVDVVDAHTLHLLDQEQRRLTVAGGGSLRVVAGSGCYRLVSRLAGYDNLQPADEQPPRLTVLHTVPHLHVEQGVGHG